MRKLLFQGVQAYALILIADGFFHGASGAVPGRWGQAAAHFEASRNHQISVERRIVA